jgi:tetratricopeptide (TPR) repeat protein
MKTYAIVRLDEIDALADGRYRYRPVRHRFGITSFGVTAWVGAAAGDPIINEYDEDSEPAEELFVVVTGRAVFELEGERVEAAPGTLVFTRQGTRRTAVAAEPATTILVFDGTPGQAYDATGWELWAPLRPLYDNGEYAELITRLEDAIAANPQYPMLVYNLACSESLSGRSAEAIEHLRRAAGASQKLRVDAREDPDFDPIRDEPSFKALVGE